MTPSWDDLIVHPIHLWLKGKVKALNRGKHIKEEAEARFFWMDSNGH